MDCGQVALFLNLVKPPWRRYDACISVLTVLRQHDYKRILISTFEHADEWHLYYNMVSFLWKGMRLEQRWVMVERSWKERCHCY